VKYPHIKIAALKAAIILVPCWTTAWLTDKMVYVVPMLAATAIFAGTFDQQNTRRRVDDDGDGQDIETEITDIG